MRKFRFSKYIVLFLAIALLPASGLSAWYFNHINHTHQLDVQLGVDDIEENYSFSDTRIEEETYTIIFYPSILYMFMDNPDQFGYILASANPNGEAVFDDSNVTTGDEGYKNVVKNNNFFLDDNYGLVDNTTNHQNVYGMNQDNGLYNNRGYQNNYYNPASDEKLHYIGNTDEQFIYASNPDGRYPRNMHLYDRFGYWKDRNYDSGRYLPIRISGISTLSSGLFNEAISTPYCDMSDPAGYYVNSFSSWVTYKYSSNEYGCFQNADLDANMIFDVLEGLDTYADENNIIRVYPFFTCGKNYNSNASKSEGMRDALRARVNNEENYMFYTNDGGETGYTYNSVPSCKYAALLNVYVDDNFTLDIDLSFCEGNKTYSSWENVFDINAGSVDITNNGPGLYNFYVAIGNCGLSNEGERFAWPIDNDINSQHCNRESVVEIEIDGIFTSNTFVDLQDKRLVQINNGLFGEDDRLGGYLSHKSGRTRPLVIAYERVIDIKLIHGIDNDINNYVNSVYNQMPNFIHLGENDEVSDTNGNQQNYSYAFVARNIDILQEYNTYLQVRFGLIYSDAVEIHNPTNPIILNGRTFQPYQTYFKSYQTTIVDNQRATQPISDEYYSIYDFVLIYGSGNIMNLYAYRHENLFIKIFNENPDRDTDGFAIHSSTTNAEVDKGLIWKATFASGDFLDLTDFNINNVSLNDALIDYFKSHSINSCVIRDRVTSIIILKYENNQLTIVSNGNNNFVIRKNYIFYLDKINNV